MPLVADRNTPAYAGDLREGPVAAAQLIYGGAMVMVNAAGYLVKGQTATGLIGVGRAEARADNSTGAAGAITARYKPGTYRFKNSTAGDLITIADIGKACYAVDDETVALTSATNTRSPAGTIDSVDANGVWVRFDAALTRAALS